ncbi:hypothetical protein B0T16DRAFT_168246 [Cercophora newfieldiana]|uniref:Uncharacterized protein n=1 Tax=Cercophora newfieldiana TaxID=92897 RepID=A0AA39Y682_9PEZI|nr:hypothetical protein B0T16DRAFT_168246 [Cercophora newfieldiana]
MIHPQARPVVVDSSQVEIGTRQDRVPAELPMPAPATVWLRYGCGMTRVANPSKKEQSGGIRGQPKSQPGAPIDLPYLHSYPRTLPCASHTSISYRVRPETGQASQVLGSLCLPSGTNFLVYSPLSRCGSAQRGVDGRTDGQTTVAATSYRLSTVPLKSLRGGGQGVARQLAGWPDVALDG